MDAEPPPGDHFDSLGLAAGDKTEARFFIVDLKRERARDGELGETIPPEVLCAVLVREPLWLEARMDDQALLEGIVVFSDEDGPEKTRT